MRSAAEQLKSEGVESVAIGFLHSYANPSHELRAAEIAREVLDDDVYVTTSAEILPVWREWERFSDYRCICVYRTGGQAISPRTRATPRRQRVRGKPSVDAFRRSRRNRR